MRTRTTVAYILASSLLGVGGQLLLKRAMLTTGPLDLQPDRLVGLLLTLALNPLVVLGLAVTVSGTFFWLVALSRVDLSWAYPFASLNYVLIMAASWILFSEQPSTTRLAGVVLIILGVLTVSRTQPKTDSRLHSDIRLKSTVRDDA